MLRHFLCLSNAVLIQGQCLVWGWHLPVFKIGKRKFLFLFYMEFLRPYALHWNNNAYLGAVLIVDWLVYEQSLFCLVCCAWCERKLREKYGCAKSWGRVWPFRAKWLVLVLLQVVGFLSLTSSRHLLSITPGDVLNKIALLINSRSEAKPCHLCYAIHWEKLLKKFQREDGKRGIL